MKRLPFLVMILMTISRIIVHGQENESVLSSPDNWQKEIIPFPISFAPEIDFKGFEDLRFSPGWSNPVSDEFWSYTFVWYIEKDSAMTESRLTGYFNNYYDGLMGVARTNTEDSTNSIQLEKTFCLFIKTAEGFKGKMRIYDAFFTKDYLILNIIVKELFCSETNKQIIRCDISPKEFDHKIWEIFGNVRLNVKCE